MEKLQLLREAHTRNTCRESHAEKHSRTQKPVLHAHFPVLLCWKCIQKSRKLGSTKKNMPTPNPIHLMIIEEDAHREKSCFCAASDAWPLFHRKQNRRDAEKHKTRAEKHRQTQKNKEVHGNTGKASKNTSRSTGKE